MRDAVHDWAAKGYVFFSDLATQSTHLRRITCPDCGAGVRLAGISEKCARGCGWEKWRQDAWTE